jgi:two-component system, NtrC family, sensor kinase
MTDSVLIVDDSMTVRMDLAHAFEHAGFHVIPCATASAARAAWVNEHIDVAILDVVLPDGDGVALLKELRTSAYGAAAVVLMLSTEAEVGDRIRGLETGADDYVGKPYDTGYVIARTRELLRDRRAPASATTTSTILVIDDSATFREELRKELERAGYSVLTAASGEEGLRIAADLRPTAVVVDGVLPGIDGDTVIRKIRLDAALRGTPCLLLTSLEGDDAELRALDAGADAFVRKHETLEVILARLQAMLRSPGQERTNTASLLGPKRVLAVDDSATYLNTLADSLRTDAYDVVLARSGEEAINILAVQPVDCILLDVVMPGLGGKEACRRIKASPVLREIPLILVTAHDERAAMIDGLSFGADDYIPKSSGFDVLKARVRAQLRRKQFEDENRTIREGLLRSELRAAEAHAQRAIAEAKAALVDELERKNKELEAFSYSVSHDLRAPLRSIDGFSVALLERYADALDPKGRDYLQRIRAAARRMAELIDALLDLSRLNRGEFYSTSVQLSAIAESIAEELKRADPERAVTFNICPHLVANGDGSLIRVLFDNLLGNAWKFTSKTTAARIEFGAQVEPHRTVYFVRDNGAGFNMAYAQRLFSPFQRLHKEADFPGTGIGLATVERIVGRHGGRAWAESAVGQGATVFFTLARDADGGAS